MAISRPFRPNFICVRALTTRPIGRAPYPRGAPWQVGIDCQKEPGGKVPRAPVGARAARAGRQGGAEGADAEVRERAVRAAAPRVTRLEWSGLNDELKHAMLSYGKGRTNPVKGAKIPKIASIDAWDGKDGELPEEEDIDLSDVDLDDHDEL